MADLDESLGMPDELTRKLMGLPPRIAPPVIAQSGGIPMPNLPRSSALPQTAPTEQAKVPEIPYPSRGEHNLAGVGIQARPELPLATLPPPVNPQQQKLNDLTASKPGYQNIQNPFLHGLAATGNALASVFPRVGAAIPGTTAHHNEQIAEQEGLLNQETGRNRIGAETEETKARAEAIGHPRPQLEMTDAGLVRVPQEGEAQAVTMGGEALQKPDISKVANPEAQAFDAYVHGGMSPQAAFRQVQQDKQEGIAAGKPEPEEKNYKQFADEYHTGHPNATVAETQRAYKLNQEMPQRPPQFFGIIPQAGGGGKAEVIRPGQTVPPGMMSPTQMGGIAENTAKQLPKELKPYQDVVDTAAMAHKLQMEGDAGNASADVDLTLSFFKMMKGQGSNIRYTMQEQKFILGARPLAEDMAAVGQKVIGEGQALTPEQRARMVHVIDMHAEAAQQAMQRLQGGGGTESAPNATPEKPAGKKKDSLGIL